MSGNNNAKRILREITLEELANHNTENDAWIAINRKVYDVTSYIKKHPGGKYSIMYGVGKDATDMFMQAHAYVNPDLVLTGKQIGILAQPSVL